MITTLVLSYLADVATAPPSTSQLVLILGLARVACLAAASCITASSRWVFWLVSFLLWGGIAVTLTRGLMQSVMRRGKQVTEVYTQIANVVVITWGIHQARTHAPLTGRIASAPASASRRAPVLPSGG